MERQKILKLILICVVIIFITKPLTAKANKNAIRNVVSKPEEYQLPGISNNFIHSTPSDSSILARETAANETVKKNIENNAATGRRCVDRPDQKSLADRRNEKRQVKLELDKKHAIQLIAGYSRHGSGDMNGILFGTEYIQDRTKRFSLNYNIRATINSSKDEYIVNNLLTGARTDASVRYTTAGVQLGINAGWSFFKTERHDLKMSFGPFGRYQSASNGSDGYSVYYPQTTGAPTVLIGYDNRTSPQTFSVGGLLQLQYDYTFSNKIYLGLVPGFQTDTNGDAILQLAFTLGIR